jgi:DNA-binding NarL/FixJ family response regulator
MAGIGDLTPREREVFHLVVKGKQNKEIADAVCLSLRGVQFHVSNILRKLKCHDRGEVQRKFSPPELDHLLLLADLVTRVRQLEQKVGI